jgi:ribosome biogenesis protein Nip4
MLTVFSSQVWVKPPGELPFLYGNHVVKAHLGRITEDTPEHQGVVVFSMSDIPLVSLGCEDHRDVVLSKRCVCRALA